MEETKTEDMVKAETADGQHPEETAADASARPSDVDGEQAGDETALAALKTQVDELQNRLLRTQADFDNYRKRTRQEKEEFGKYASMKLIEQLLPIVDNFERALAANRPGSEADAWVKGIEMVYRQMVQTLEQEGLAAIHSVGEPFNPEFHQAIMQVESDEHEEGIVVEEIQKGYKLKDKVIRPALVKVSS